MNLLSQKATPRDCTLAFGIPISISEYRNNVRSPVARDFSARYAKNEREYRWAMVDDVDLILPAIERLGVRVEREVSLERFGRLLDERADSAVILFSHWHADQVEFADGLQSVSKVVDAVPTTFQGIFDLSVCHPINLVVRLRAERPYIAMIRFTSVSTTPRLWLLFYLALFKTLAENQSSYVEALDQTLAEVVAQLDRP